MPHSTRFVVGGGKKEIFCNEDLVHLGSVTRVSEHAFVGGEIPLLDVGVGRTSIDVSIKYCGTRNVTLMSSAK